MDGCFDSVDGVEGVIWKGNFLRCVSIPLWARSESTYHEVSLDKPKLIRKSLLLSIDSCPLDLILIEIQPSDMSTSKLDDFSSRSTNTAANV